MIDETRMSTPSWETFYALGWYDVDGRAYLTTWSGDLPVVRRLSIDCAPHRIPLWKAAVPSGAKLVAIPDDPAELDKLQRERCGRIVIGWELEPFERAASPDR